jgi:hypothetical protein
VISLSATSVHLFTKKKCLVLTKPQIQHDVKVYKVLISGLLPTRPPAHDVPELTDELWDFMMDCWSTDPRLRPAMIDARNFLAQLERRQGSNSISRGVLKEFLYPLSRSIA